MAHTKNISTQIMIANRMIIGWAYDSHNSALSVVLTDIDENVLAETQADCILDDIEKQKTQLDYSFPCGFRFAIPQCLLDGERHDLNLSVKNWKLPQDPKPIKFYFSAPEIWQEPVIPKANHPKIKMLGHIDTINAEYIAGFIVDLNMPYQMLHILLLVDNVPVMRIRPNHLRLDIAERLGLDEKSAGIWGFHVTLPWQIKDGKDHEIKLICQETGELLNQGNKTIRFASLGKPLVAKKTAYFPKVDPNLMPVVSVIVLNRNGASPLQELLESWYQHNTLPVEWIVVDHASTDNSLTLLQEWAERIPLRIIALDFNNSFSASCNLAAQQANSSYLLFLNNDIVWLQDALPAMLNTLLIESSVGLVGLKLITRDEGWIEETQHLGIRFALHGNQYWPYEVSPLTDQYCLTHSPESHTGVTGAVMLCRKKDFDHIHGFDERYFYGFEDVDLSLRMIRDLDKTCLCRNDLVALHRHGYTRLTGRERKVFDRQTYNAAVLEKNWGLWLKQIIRQKKFSHDQVWLKRDMICVVLLDDPSTEQGQQQFQHAAQLIKTLNTLDPELTWQLVLVYEDLTKLQQADCLFVFSDRADIRQLTLLPVDSLKVAVYDASPRYLLWQQQPWWQSFDDHVAVTDLLHATTAYWQHWARQLRLAILLPIQRAECEKQHPLWLAVTSLQSRLRQEHVSVRCYTVDEWSKRDFVCDVVVHIYSENHRYLIEPRVDAVNVLWALDAPIGLAASTIERFDVLWQASEIVTNHINIPVHTCYPWVESTLTLQQQTTIALEQICTIDTKVSDEVDHAVEKPLCFIPALGQLPSYQPTWKHLNLKVSTANFTTAYMPSWIGWAAKYQMSISLNDIPLVDVLEQPAISYLVNHLQQLLEQRCGSSVYSS